MTDTMKCRACNKKYELDGTALKDEGFCSRKCEVKGENKRKAKPPVLPGAFKTVFETTYRAFEDFVKTCYPQVSREYSFVETQECSNDTDHDFKSNGISALDREDYEKFKKGEIPSWFSNYFLLDCLVEDGFLQPGNYLITVRW